MAPNRRNMPSVQKDDIPASTAPVTSRARRSQTREQVPAAATQPHPTRRSARAKSVESIQSNAKSAGKTHRRVEAPQEIEQVDLTTVEEQSDDEDVDLEIPPPDEVSEVRATPGQDDEAVGDRSLHSMSGTTVRSDDNFEDGDDELDPHVLLTYGPAVYHAAEILVERFDEHQQVLLKFLNELDRTASNERRQFDRDNDKFTNAVLQLPEAFGEGQILLAPNHIMPSLFKQSLPHMTSECWHIIEMIQLLNLAIIARQIVQTPIETNEMTENLRKLDVQFPFAFLKDLDVNDESNPVTGNSNLRDETFEVALAIRLQTTVLLAQRDFNAEQLDIDQLIQTMFFNESDGQSTLRVWDVNGLGSGDSGLLPEYEAKMKRRIKRFRTCVEDDVGEIADGAQVGMQMLTRNFPWLEFRATVLKWIGLRMREVAGSIDLIGGVEKMMDEVRAELSKDPTFDPDAGALPPPSPAKSGSRNDSNNRNEVRESSVSISITSPLSTTSGNKRGHRRTQDDAPVVQADEDFGDRLRPNHADLLLTIAENQRQRKENIRQLPADVMSPSRRRQYVDEQDDAERITNFDEATQPSSNIRSSRDVTRSGRANRKRPQSSGNEDDVSDDGGFDLDAREIDVVRRRRDAPRPGLSPKRVRIEEPSQRSQNLPTRQIVDPRDNPVLAYATQKQMETLQAARAPSSSAQRYKPRQARRAWSAAEELRLEDYICEYGISWALLKEMDAADGNLFEGRDQVALKDKARNMKTQMLLNGVDPLPRNWENVPLDKKAIERLQRGGIGMDRLLKAGVGFAR